jgi:hypothetical protein
VVDPLGDLDRYLRDAERLSVAIRYVIDTHLHADHLSVGRDLATAANAAYVLYSDVDVGFDFQGVRDGDILPLANDAITIWHTPGHTPEHVSLLVADKTRADEPWLAKPNEITRPYQWQKLFCNLWRKTNSTLTRISSPHSPMQIPPRAPSHSSPKICASSMTRPLEERTNHEEVTNDSSACRSPLLGRCGGIVDQLRATRDYSENGR